ncbi:MAG: GNAT family N-acetyltransferase [Lachnospiraceae bacterium]|nr:GNAT family N-acetyltransferase [Lachnospiraceae bacterium]
MAVITLTPLTDDDREQFILDNQRAFKYGATEEFGERDNHFEEDGEIISRKTIEACIDTGKAYRIRENGQIAGGLVLSINESAKRGNLELLFVNPKAHSKGIGYATWQEVERMYPQITVWETFTPYFETRNIHFYVNKCGFHIVEFFNKKHPDPHEPETGEENNYDEKGSFDGMFRFEKQINHERKNQM